MIPEEPKYFIRLKTQVPLHSGPPIPESKLPEEISFRGWKSEDIEKDEADLKFLPVLKPYYDSTRR